MNSKKAKALRRLAERVTIGAPATGYERHAIVRSRRVMPGTTRAVYHDMKRALARG